MQTTRTRAEELELTAGQIVYVRKDGGAQLRPRAAAQRRCQASGSRVRAATALR